MIWNDRIRDLRERRKMTLKDLSKRLGVSEATAQRYESGNGIKSVPYEIVEKYAAVFDVDPSYIMGWSKNEKNIDYGLTKTEQELYSLIMDMSDGQINKAIALIKYLRNERRLNDFYAFFCNLELFYNELDIISDLIKGFGNAKELMDRAKERYFYRNY